jgi:hypothetical protein
LILSLLLMALPFGNALAAGVQDNSCVNRTVLIRQICSADRTSDLYSRSFRHERAGTFRP